MPLINQEFGRQIGLGIEGYSIHGTCSVFVASHYAIAESTLGAGRYDLSQDVIACEVEESFQGSTANVTLLPNRPYTNWIFPGDWISVYMSSNADAPAGLGVVGRRETRFDNTRVFFGFIQAIRENSSHSESGSQVRYSISCFGVQQAFDKTNIYFNKALGPQSLFGGFLPGLAQLSYGLPLFGTPASIPRGIAMAYMGHGGQFQVPSNYPQGFGSLQERQERLANAFQVALAVEHTLGLLAVRGAVGVQKRSMVERAMQQARQEVLATSFAGMIDLFSYVEDLYVDGRVLNTPYHEQAGSLWNIMMENVNPIMNEMFISLLPERDNATGERLLKGDKDEWGQRPKLTPCMVIRERPFAWRQEFLEVPGMLGIQGRDLMFGDVFFSDRSKAQSLAHRYPRLQMPNPRESGNAQNVLFRQAVEGALLETSIRAVERVQLDVKYIFEESVGLSDNDMFNFFMITQSDITLATAYQKFVHLLDGLIPIFYPESIKRHGLRVKEMATKFMYTGGGQIASQKGLAFMTRCLMAYDLWYQHSMFYRGSSISCRPIPAARAGMVLDVSGAGREESFYIEGMNLSFSQAATGGGRLSQSFTCTRGQPSGFTNPQMRYPYAPPDIVKVYGVGLNGTRGASIPRPDAAVQLPVQRIPQMSDAKKLELLLDIVAETGVKYGLNRELDVWANEVDSFPPGKITSAQALELWTDNPAVLGQAKYDAQQRFLTATAPKPQPPVIKIKEDRLLAGTAPHERSPWLSSFWSAARSTWRNFRHRGAILRVKEFLAKKGRDS